MLTSLPNLLTLSRVGVIPLIVALFYVPGDWPRYVACILFTVAGFTDVLDGHLARARAQISAVGRILDPIADKLLVVSVTAMLLVSGLREVLADIRLRVPVSRLAKWKTAIQMTALGFLIVGDAGFAFLPVRLIGEILLWIAVTLTLVTGYAYFRAAFGALLSGRPRRARPVPKVGKQATLPG
jgi:cardiolipin synthase